MRTKGKVKSEKQSQNMASFHLSVKVGKRGTGGAHADYVQREGAYENYRGGEELAHTESINMPSWAEHSPSEFFRQADLNERANGSSYREYEIAIPRELSPEQRIEFVREFVQQEIGKDHPCTWAIHNPKASIEGGDQPHAHIMFSDRKLDGIERNPELFFKRANAKAPEKGGCAKANTAASKAERKEKLVGLRERFATLQNAHLAKHGHADRVTHRSLDAQGIERRPERHLGPVTAREQNASFDVRLHRAAHQRATAAENAVAQIDIPGRIKAIKQEQRHEQQNNRHRQYQARTAAPRRDSVPRMHERRHYRDADRAQHLLPGNAFDRLGEREAKQRADRVQLERDRKRDQWRDRLTDRRQAWKACAVRPRDQQPAAGQPRVFEWGAGKAEGRPAFVDHGDRIKPAGNPDKVSDGKIRAMLAHAESKGWKEVIFTGPQEFRERCAAAAVERGFKLADVDLAQRFAPKPEPARSTEAPRKVTPSNTPAPKAQAPAPAKAVPTQTTYDRVQAWKKEQREAVKAAPEQAKAEAKPEAKAEPVKALDEKKLVHITERDRALADQTEKAIQSDNPKELERCYDSLAGHTREAQHAVAAIPDSHSIESGKQDALRNAEHEVRAEQNREETAKGSVPPWGISRGENQPRMGGDEKVNAWGRLAEQAKQQALAHKDGGPPKVFGKDAWHKQDGVNVDKYNNLKAAAARIEKEFAARLAEKQKQIEAKAAEQATRNAPAREKAIERVKGLEHIKERLVKALEPHKERQKQKQIEHEKKYGKDYGMGGMGR